MEEKVLEGFGYQNVSLGDSHWERQRRECIETYLAIDNDALLYYFRDLAGLNAPGQTLTGWYGKGAGTFGQKLGAFAKLYRTTGDYRLKEKAVYLAEEWGRCALASSKVLDVNDTYIYEKLLGGFLDLYEYLDHQPAVEYIKKLTDSARRRFRRDIPRDGLQDEALTKPDCMIEWYTLPENLYRAYQLTGDQMYLSFANEWEYPYLWDKLKDAQTDKIGPRHAYSQVNSLSSAARAFEVKKDPYYLEVLEKAYDEITRRHMFATGGYGPAECIFPEEKSYLGDSLKDSWDKSRQTPLHRNFGGGVVDVRNDNWGSCEVSCSAWAVFKLTNYMLRFTGKAAYGDWEERLLYNGTGGQPPVTADGKVMYYADYFVDGAVKSVEDSRLQESGAAFQWQCCTGTFPQDVAEYSNMLYYHDEETLYTAQYLPSAVSWDKDGYAWSMENFSRYPQEETLKFVIHSQRIEKRRLAFRVPAWASGKNTVFVNQKPFMAAITPGEWLILDREWQDGDTVQIQFEFVLRFEPADEYSPDLAALVYGPLVLCTDAMAVLKGDMTRPEEWIQKVPATESGQAVEFETIPGHVKGYDFLTRRFKPYYLIPEMEWYYMYVKIES